MNTVVRQAGRVAGGALGVTAAVAAGLAAGRLVAGRSLARLPDEAPVPGSVGLGRPARVRTDDGLVLDAEVDEPLEPPHASAPVPTVVLAHGYALSRACWHYQRLHLRRRYRVVSYDQRSHGHSQQAPADTCTVAACGRDLGSVIDQLVPTGPVVLIGHSMGGMSILSLAAQRPQLLADRVNGAALLCTTAGGLGDFAFGLDGALGSLVGKGTPALVRSLRRAPRLLEHGCEPGHDLSLVLTRMFTFGGPVPRARLQFVAGLLAATPLGVLADFYPTFGGFDGTPGVELLAGQLVGTGRPTLVVGAAQDRITPVAHSRALATRLPGADYLELDPCGHMAMIEHPKTVNDRLSLLLARAERR